MTERFLKKALLGLHVSISRSQTTVLRRRKSGLRLKAQPSSLGALALRGFLFEAWGGFIDLAPHFEDLESSYCTQHFGIWTNLCIPGRMCCTLQAFSHLTFRGLPLHLFWNELGREVGGEAELTHIGRPPRLADFFATFADMRNRAEGYVIELFIFTGDDQDSLS